PLPSQQADAADMDRFRLDADKRPRRIHGSLAVRPRLDHCSHVFGRRWGFLLFLFLLSRARQGAEHVGVLVAPLLHRAQLQSGALANRPADAVDQLTRRAAEKYCPRTAFIGARLNARKSPAFEFLKEGIPHLGLGGQELEGILARVADRSE